MHNVKQQLTESSTQGSRGKFSDLNSVQRSDGQTIEAGINPPDNLKEVQETPDSPQPQIYA